jgi:type IV pilus assembly protein PilC
MTDDTQPLSEPSSTRVAVRPLPAVVSLWAMVEESTNARQRRGMSQILQTVEKGQPLAEAFSTASRDIPEGLRQLLVSAESTGQLDLILASYLDTQRRSQDVLWTIMIALAYPMAMFAAICVGAFGLLAVVVPQFKSIFTSFGTSVPWITTFVLTLSDAMASLGPGRLGIWLLAIVLVGWGLKQVLGPEGWRELFSQLPVVGGFQRDLSGSRFCQVLAALIEARMPLGPAMRLAARTTEHPSFIRSAAAAEALINSGVEPTQAVAQARLLDRDFASVFCWCDRPEDFAMALRGASDVHRARLLVNTSFLGWILEPVLLVSSGAFVGLVALAMFMPLIKLLNDLS